MVWALRSAALGRYGALGFMGFSVWASGFRILRSSLGFRVLRSG